MQLSATAVSMTRADDVAGNRTAPDHLYILDLSLFDLEFELLGPNG